MSRSDLVELVRKAGWPIEQPIGKVRTLRVLPPNADAVRIPIYDSGDTRALRNALASLRRAGLDEAIAKRERRQQTKRQRALDESRAAADRRARELLKNPPAQRPIPPAPKPPELLSVDEVAEVLDRTGSWVTKRIRGGELHAQRKPYSRGPGYRWVVEWQDVVDFVTVSDGV